MGKVDKFVSANSQNRTKMRNRIEIEKGLPNCFSINLDFKIVHLNEYFFIHALTFV